MVALQAKGDVSTSVKMNLCTALVYTQCAKKMLSDEFTRKQINVRFCFMNLILVLAFHDNDKLFDKLRVIFQCPSTHEHFIYSE